MLKEHLGQRRTLFMPTFVKVILTLLTFTFYRQQSLI